MEKEKMRDLEKKAKDCIENHTHKLVDKPTKQDIYLREESIFISGYKLGAEENTALLSQHILELQETNGSLTDRINRLEHELKAEQKMRQYWHEEYVKEVEGNE